MDDLALDAAYAARNGLLARYISREELRHVLAAWLEAEADLLEAKGRKDMTMVERICHVRWLRQRAASLRASERQEK